MANFSQINAVKGGQVKTVEDLWLVRSGALVPAIEAWAVKGGALVRVWERYGGATTLTWLAPTASTALHNDPITWRVKVEQGSWLVKPRGTVTFSFSDGQSEVATINTATGIAEVTAYHEGGQTVTATASLTSTNGFTASNVVKALTISGGEVTLSWVSPSSGQQFWGPQNITWTVKADPKNGQIPTGTVRFAGPSGYNYTDLDENGYASTTYWHDSGNTIVTAQLTSSAEAWSSQPIDRTIRMMINTRYQRTEYYTNAGFRNYAGANGGATTGTVAVCGDLSGTSHRAFTLVNRPVKPESDAYCVAAHAVYTPASASAGVRIGYHTINGFPATGSFSQGGVNQNLVTGSGAQGIEHWVDIGLHVAAAINNDTLRGLVFGGPSGSTPYTWISGTAYMGLVVVWEWWRWIDT